MQKKILTLDNLYQFFVEQNKSTIFSAKESGEPIVVRTEGYFEAEDNGMPGMLKLKLKVCHIDTNRNGSHISKDNMEKAMPTLKYRPILAHIHELADGTKDFYAHNVEFVENEDGETEVVYIEKQVGCFTADNPWLEYDEEQDKTYVMAYAVIPEDYTEAADIIRRKKGTKVSCELVIEELSYNAKDKYLDLISFYFGGCTLLGKDENGNDIGEGMIGARADIADFCHKKPTFNYQEQLIKTLEKLNFTLESFNKENNVTDKGGERDMEKFNKLLAKYSKTAEEITFEIEGLSDEELEAKFVEEFGEADEGTTSTTEENDPSVSNKGEGGEGNDGNDPEPAGADGGDPEPEVKFNKVFTVELSHEDIKTALYMLIKPYEEEDNEWYYIRETYEDYFLMQGMFYGKIYKLGYSVDGENVSLEGDRQEMFELIVTESEKLALEKMREDYSALETKYNELKEFKDNYDANVLKAQKDEVFAKAEYECLKDDDAFKKLVEDADKYSVEELVMKADLCFAAHVKAVGAFSAKPVEVVKPKTMGIAFAKKEEDKRPYGSLFDVKK